MFRIGTPGRKNVSVRRQCSALENTKGFESIRPTPLIGSPISNAHSELVPGKI